jgi:hypothetical protein
LKIVLLAKAANEKREEDGGREKGGSSEKHEKHDKQDFSSMRYSKLYRSANLTHFLAKQNRVAEHLLYTSNIKR